MPACLPNCHPRCFQMRMSAEITLRLGITRWSYSLTSTAKPDNRVCCPIKKQQLCWKKVEFFRSKFYYQKRNISHIKSQSVAASLPNFPRISPSLSLRNGASPASQCWCQGPVPLPPRYPPCAIDEPTVQPLQQVYLDRWCPQGCGTRGIAGVRGEDPWTHQAAVASRTTCPLCPWGRVLRPVALAVRIAEVARARCWAHTCWAAKTQFTLEEGIWINAAVSLWV